MKVILQMIFEKEMGSIPIKREVIMPAALKMTNLTDQAGNITPQICSMKKEPIKIII